MKDKDALYPMDRPNPEFDTPSLVDALRPHQQPLSIRHDIGGIDQPWSTAARHGMESAITREKPRRFWWLRFLVVLAPFLMAFAACWWFWDLYDGIHR